MGRAVKFYVTDEALKAFHNFLEKRSCHVPIRIGVGKSFKYFVECVEEITQDDIALRFGEITLILNNTSAHLLNGAVLYWRKSDKEQGFKIYNPSEELWKTFSEYFGWMA